MNLCRNTLLNSFHFSPMITVPNTMSNIQLELYTPLWFDTRMANATFINLSNIFISQFLLLRICQSVWRFANFFFPFFSPYYVFQYKQWYLFFFLCSIVNSLCMDFYKYRCNCIIRMNVAVRSHTLPFASVTSDSMTIKILLMVLAIC